MDEFATPYGLCCPGESCARHGNGAEEADPAFAVRLGQSADQFKLQRQRGEIVGSQVEGSGAFARPRLQEGRGELECKGADSCGPRDREKPNALRSGRVCRAMPLPSSADSKQTVG